MTREEKNQHTLDAKLRSLYKMCGKTPDIEIPQAEKARLFLCQWLFSCRVQSLQYADKSALAIDPSHLNAWLCLGLLNIGRNLELPSYPKIYRRVRERMIQLCGPERAEGMLGVSNPPVQEE